MSVVVMFGSQNEEVAEEGEEDGRWRRWPEMPLLESVGGEC
jgi:hypothetical protein